MAQSSHDLTTPSPERAATVMALLRATYPDARCSLNFDTPLELLVATVLSAQCTDERVNLVTATLFTRYRTAEEYARVPLETLEQDIKSTGFYRSKARHIQEAARLLVERHGGEVPRAMDDLTALPGVARKTANVVLGNAYGIVEGVVVDTHVGRLARRLGFTTQEDPVKVELELMALLPRSDWLDLSHLLIAHGRALCQAKRPLCEECFLLAHCPTGQANRALAVTPAPAKAVRRARRAPDA